KQVQPRSEFNILEDLLLEPDVGERPQFALELLPRIDAERSLLRQRIVQHQYQAVRHRPQKKLDVVGRFVGHTKAQVQVSRGENIGDKRRVSRGGIDPVVVQTFGELRAEVEQGAVQEMFGRLVAVAGNQGKLVVAFAELLVLDFREA